jgi:hypothetical protein
MNPHSGTDDALDDAARSVLDDYIGVVQRAAGVNLNTTGYAGIVGNAIARELDHRDQQAVDDNGVPDATQNLINERARELAVAAPYNLLLPGSGAGDQGNDVVDQGKSSIYTRHKITLY